MQISVSYCSIKGQRLLVLKIDNGLRHFLFTIYADQASVKMLSIQIYFLFRSELLKVVHLPITTFISSYSKVNIPGGSLKYSLPESKQPDTIFKNWNKITA
jgi:hypothetical protein